MVDTARIITDDDTRLLLKVAAGNYAAYEKLYRKYCLVIIDYLASLGGDIDSREDIVQEVFLRIWQNRQGFRGQSTAKTYIFGIANNAMREHLRQVRRQDLVCRLLSETSNAVKSEPVFCNEELAKVVQTAKSKLSGKQRQALELVLYSRMSTAEAAKLTGCTNSTFRRRLYDAKKRMSLLLEKNRKP